MGVSDFLFQGQAPVPAPTGSDTTVQFPLWLQQSIYNTIGAATDLAGQPYTPYQGPRIAAPSQATQNAWAMTQGALGSYRPFMEQAGALTSAATKPWSADDVKPFMNPYQDYVTAGLNRNLEQTVLPGIQDKFVAAGQSRSPQELEMTMRAVADNQNAIGSTLAQGYGSALNAALANRNSMMSGASQFGALGEMSQRLRLGDIGALGAVGQAQDQNRQSNIDAAYGDFAEQRAWPYLNLSYLSDIVRGMPTQFGGYTQSTRGIDYPSTYAPSPFSTFLQAGYGGSLRRGGPVRPRYAGGGALSYRRAA